MKHGLSLPPERRLLLAFQEGLCSMQLINKTFELVCSAGLTFVWEAPGSSLDPATVYTVDLFLGFS
jgi:hypothetical protein